MDVALDPGAGDPALVDPEVEALLPSMWGGKVEIETRDGHRYSTFKRQPKGDPEQSLSGQELEMKFMKLATKEIGDVKAHELNQQLGRLEDLVNVRQLIAEISYFSKV